MPLYYHVDSRQSHLLHFHRPHTPASPPRPLSSLFALEQDHSAPTEPAAHEPFHRDCPRDLRSRTSASPRPLPEHEVDVSAEAPTLSPWRRLIPDAR